jgi:two-component system LytT family response regulator
MLNAIIIDDEPESLRTIAEQVKLFCPTVLVKESCDNAMDGFKAIVAHQPDLLFLDIEMPGMTGLEMLEQIPDFTFGVIFITAYNKYAVNAIKLSALDYLLKPLDPDELIAAVEKAEKKINRERTIDRYKLMMDLMNRSDNLSRNQQYTIALPTFESIIYKRMDAILRIEAQQNYCRFYFTEGNALVISKNIGAYDESLEPYDFMRVHRSHIVNLRSVREFLRHDGGYLRLSDGKEIPISKNKKERILERLAGL